MQHDQTGIMRLNFVRSLAVVIVLVSHYSNEMLLWDGLLGAGAGQFGVMLFFVLSSFLMSCLYFNQPPTGRGVREFLAARVARVLPLYFLVVIVTFAWQKVMPAPWSEVFSGIGDAASLVSHLTLLYGVGILWTIPPEMQFYLLFALIWWLSGRFRHAWLVPVALLVLYVAHPTPTPLEGHLGALPCKLALVQAYPYFCVGFLLGWLYRHWTPNSAWQRHWHVAVLVLIPLAFPQVLLRLTGWTHGMWGDPLVLLLVAFVFFTILFLVPARNPLLENRLTNFIAGISYSIYLLHIAVLTVIKNLGLHASLVSFTVFLAAIVGVAWLSYSVVEMPTRRWLRALLDPTTSD